MRETTKDRATQHEVACLLKKRYNVEVTHTRTLDPYDMVLYRGQERIALVEVRRRNVNKTAYKDYWMSYEKFKRLRLLGEAFEVPVLYVIRFDDCVSFVDLMKYPKLPTSYGDRGNPSKPRKTDNEKVVCLMTDYFEDIGVK